MYIPIYIFMYVYIYLLHAHGDGGAVEDDQQLVDHVIYSIIYIYIYIYAKHSGGDWSHSRPRLMFRSRGAAGYIYVIFVYIYINIHKYNVYINYLLHAHGDGGAVEDDQQLVDHVLDLAPLHVQQVEHLLQPFLSARYPCT